jgi:hypothetical protein
MGILDKAVKLHESQPYVKMVLHGAEGVGKTTFTADAPNPTFVDFERSTDTLAHDDRYKEIPVLRPGLQEDGSVVRMKDVFAYAKAVIGKYDTIIFDTVTSMQIFYMNEYMADIEKKNSNRDKYIRFQGDYGYATNELTDFFLFLQNAPINVIFNAHSDFERNEENRLVAIRPSLTPRVWGNLRAFISVVAYYEKITTGMGDKAKTERRLYLNSTNVITAKNRLQIKETYIVDPTFKELFSNE